MRYIIVIIAVLAATIALAAPTAWAGNAWGQTDDWSGFRWARDDDGDGIPNGLDPDWTRPRDGSGYGPSWLFFGPLLSGPFGDVAGNQNRHEWRHERHRNGDPTGDMLRDRLRLRDGSCKD